MKFYFLSTSQTLVDLLNNYYVPLILTLERPFNRLSGLFPFIFYTFCWIPQAKARLIGIQAAPTASRTSSTTYHWKHLVFSAYRWMACTD